MSTFEGLRIIRAKQLEYPDYSIDEILPLVRVVNSDGSNYDYEAALFLHSKLSSDIIPSDAQLFYQHCINCSIDFQPVWMRTITLGRQKFYQKLSDDEAQCFDAAGLMATPATPEILSWWLQVCSRLRSALDAEKALQGRSAELLSLEHEHDRLQRLRINLIPQLTCLEDNTAGYDILSYDAANPSPTARLIEVKSTIASPLRFFITRNEWEIALKYGNAYHFHIWDMRSKTLYERTVEDIRPNIPADNATGKWATAIIPISGR